MGDEGKENIHFSWDMKAFSYELAPAFAVRYTTLEINSVRRKEKKTSENKQQIGLRDGATSLVSLDRVGE